MAAVDRAAGSAALQFSLFCTFGNFYELPHSNKRQRHSQGGLHAAGGWTVSVLQLQTLRGPARRFRLRRPRGGGGSGQGQERIGSGVARWLLQRVQAQETYHGGTEARSRPGISYQEVEHRDAVDGIEVEQLAVAKDSVR